MSAALILLAALVGITPDILLIDDTVIDGLILSIVAIGIALVALNVRSEEASRLSELVRPIGIVALIPAVWMLVQIMPLSKIGLAHPIWTSAMSALGRPVTGSITIDIGATLLCFSSYLGFLATVLLATAVSIDRQRAGLLLMILTGVTTLIAAELVGYDFGYFQPYLGDFGDTFKHSEVLDSAALGSILSTAFALRTFEQHRSRRRRQREPIQTTLAIMVPAAAFIICLSALLLNWNMILLVGVLCGIGTLMTVAAVRWLGLDRWGKFGITTLAFLAVVGIIATATEHQNVDATLALSSATSGSLSIAQRILADVAWTGTGGGTFTRLLPIYRFIGEIGGAGASTAAATVAIEMGRPMLLAILVIIIYVISRLIGGALRRGRDFSYPASGAGCLLAILILTFDNAGMLGSSISSLVGAIIGLSLGQSKSWTDGAQSRY